jgi:LmbE family N-acetylglucosaminyl deacetylase
MAERVLVVAAHPDDEVLGAGGTLARHAGAGDEVTVLILGQGVAARFAAQALAPSDLVARLREQAVRAGEVLGVKEVRFGSLALADNRFDESSLLEIVKTVEAAIRELSPAVVYTHHPGCLNIDHRLTFQAVLTATRPGAGCPVVELLVFEVLSSTEWAFGRLGPVFSPNVFVDIAETLQLKVQALKCYKDELREAPHLRSLEVVRANAARWGAVVGRTAAEAFELVRGVR